MPDNYVYGILEDEEHRFWISSNTGVYVFYPQEERFVNYSVRDGLQGNEFNARAFHKGASGTFYFGGTNGFNFFHPGEASHEMPPPRVAITDAFIGEQSVRSDTLRPWISTLMLDHNENDLAFSFAVLDYTRPEANKIRYKLEGWEENFTSTYIKNVRYSNLPPGEYTLRIRGSSNGQTWGDEETLDIIIRAPFWQTDLFYGGVIGLVIAGLVGTTRAYYKRKIRRKLYEWEKQHAVLQERERISKDMHDDLGAGLSTIVILGELTRQRSHQDEYTAKQLTKISEVSRALIRNFNELIWSHNPVNDSLQKLLWYVREQLGDLFEGTGTEFRMSFPEDIPDIPLQAERRRNFFLVIKELLHNILKHAAATKAALEVTIRDSRVIITVWDNGVGFELAAKADTGNGLGNMKKRMKACEGDLEIETIIGNGTRVTLTAPLK